jgi:hypothetical protein
MYISPENKDYDRAKNLLPAGYSGDPASKISTKARTQANSIKDKAKLVRRSAAVAVTWGDTKYFRDAWEPFAKALADMGFSFEDIISIRDYNSNTPRGNTVTKPKVLTKGSLGKIKY